MLSDGLDDIKQSHRRNPIHIYDGISIFFFLFILIRCDNNVCKLLLFHDGTSISVVIQCGKTYFLQFISNLQYFSADYVECFTTEIANVWQVCLINLGKYTYESIVKFCS